MEGSGDAQSTSVDKVVLREHSNENLLKIDTHDKYSTVATIKKTIMKDLPPPKTNAPPQPLFNGMIRMAKNPNMPYLFIAFQTPEDRAAASALLQSISHRGKRPWSELTVTPRDLQLTHKGGNKKRPRDEGETAGSSKVSLWENCAMDEQLARKRTHCLRVVESIATGSPDELFADVYASPELHGYRNHVNLSFGRTEGGEPTIGFMKGSMIEGTCAVESALDKDIVTMNPLAKLIAQAVHSAYDDFAAPEQGGLTVFNKTTQRGFWRSLQIRHNVRGEAMVDIELDLSSVPVDIADAVTKRLAEVLRSDALKAALQAASGKETAAVISAQYHSATGIATAPHDTPRHILFGTATLTEHLCGLQYELSPTSFFQVNTPGMELLLREAAALAGLTDTTTLLDLCCGTGTIGLTLAARVRRVVGIELVESAVLNARLNAERNGVRNATFHCGRVENLLPDVINALPAEDKKDIVAILDPPRAGVTPTVLKWIRGTPTIRRVVYISCEQKALVRDCPALTKPSTKAYRCSPFAVTASFAVDLFPHTPHVEMIVVLTRQEDTE